jgi:hypothetical protein
MGGVMAMLDFNDTTERPVTIALGYAARGWPVFPCNPLSKAPLTEHGFKEATLEPLKIRGWWAKWPRAMIGVPTGATAGFWVLDIDQDKAKGKNGVASLAEMGRDLSELMDTVVANTGSGGLHCLFRFDPARPISNARGHLPKDIDVRGNGGYIVAAGSTKADGGRYDWINPPDEIEIAEAPDWLYDVILGSQPADGFDFNGARPAPTPAQRVERIAPGTWHENTRDIVARMVREGCSDETIAAIAPRFTERGYSDDQTIREFLTHARTAREKWGYQPREVAPEPEPGAPFRFKVTAYDDIAEEHHKSWLIADMLGAGEYTVMYGAPGCGKSVLMGDAAAHVAAGLEWFGRRTTPCGVLYIAAERAGLVKRRLAAWRKRHGVLGLPIEVVEGAFDFCTGPLDPSEILRILAWMAEKHSVPVGWVIIDTKAQVMASGDENSSREIGAFNLNVARFQATGAHVTVIDHTPIHDPTRMRGSGALAGAADGSYLVKKEAGARVLTIGSKAPNDGPDELEIVFGLESVVLGVREGQQTKAPVVIPAQREAPTEEPNDAAPLQQKILRLITQAHADGRKVGFTSLKAATGANQGTLSKALRKMTDAGRIIEVPIEGGKLWTLP